jgi:hypothetical protein
MNIYFWIAVAVGGWCAVAAIVALVLGPAIAFGTETMPIVASKEAAGKHKPRMRRMPVGARIL